MNSLLALVPSLAVALSLPAATTQIPSLQSIQAQTYQSIAMATNHAQNLSSSLMPGAQPVRMTEAQRQLIDETNRFRMQHGMKPLRPTNYLNGVAQNWANSLARTGALHHNPAIRSRAVSVYGENIHMTSGKYSPQRAVQSWANSPGHRANMLRPTFTEIGVGIATAPNGLTYVVQNFA